ncbi:MAG: endoribonuclease YicC domain-containing protein, partial [Myxococcota bacterium]
LERLLPGAAHAVPPERLAQEIALLVERSDVEEELERLRGHLVAFQEAIDSPGAHGRRLDFLAQEIQRELSTLGAKARDLELTRLVVDAKLVNEQLREQIQNVE